MLEGGGWGGEGASAKGLGGGRGGDVEVLEDAGGVDVRGGM